MKPCKKIQQIIGIRMCSLNREILISDYQATPSEAKRIADHIQSLLTGDMTWENHGKHWEIDHIIPCAAFYSTDKQHMRWCWHHKNLQPLTVRENMEKKDKMPSGESAAFLWANNPDLLKELRARGLDALGVASYKEIMSYSFVLQKEDYELCRKDFASNGDYLDYLDLKEINSPYVFTAYKLAP